MKPLVSVNIRTYNSAKTLTETLASVKKQTYPHIEIVVSDGFSKDNSVAIAKKFGARISYEEKLGDARHKNYKNSRGTYVLSLDSDQVLDPKLISTCVRQCEDKAIDAVTISEKSIIQKGTLVEKLIAYDKWVIDKNQDADVTFGTACPRFFRKSVLSRVHWPENLAVFDDTILYNELVRRGAKVTYLSHPSIHHHEVSSWFVFFRKFFRYGQGYVQALKEQPGTIAAHSLPRRSYFSLAALTKPQYFFGLLLLYFVKVLAAGFGVVTYLLRNFFVFVGDYPYYGMLAYVLRDMHSVLDVGCGSNSPLANVPKTFHSTGVDIYKPSIEESKKQKIHDEYKTGNVFDIDKLFKGRKFDAVVALDLIEHLSKETGWKLLAKMEKLARKKVVLLTPNGFITQTPVDGNEFQRHLSGWSIEDFKKHGYRIYGMRGLKWLRGEYATITWKPWFFWAVVSSVSELLVFFVPVLANQLFVVKEKKLRSYN